MKAYLSGTWELSTENTALSDDRPVLVNRKTGGALGPKDIVNLYPSWRTPYGFMPASDAVRRLAKTKKLDEEELALVGRFIKGTKGDERQ